MKTTTLSCLAVAVSSAAVVLAGGVQIATPDNMRMPLLLGSQGEMFAPEAPLLNDTADLEARQATDINAAPTQNPLQVPSVTIQDLETLLPGATKPVWMKFTYTQTFVPTPDPWPQPGVGTIGLGTLTKTKKDKRDEPQATAVILIPFEMVIRNIKVERAVHPVVEVEVIKPVILTQYIFADPVSRLNSSVLQASPLSGQTTDGARTGTPGGTTTTATAIRTLQTRTIRVLHQSRA